MEDNIDEAVIMLSKLTQRVSNITIFSILIVVIFILGPFNVLKRNKKFIKIVLVIILSITILTNYTGISNIEDRFRKQIDNNEGWATIDKHITYSYVYSSMLGVFIIYLLYTCL